ncbi:MAG: methyltransferase domain-containing protein [Vicinamibacterales bacterium]
MNRIVRELGRPFTEVSSILDLGCGTGAAGAGWARACSRKARVTGVDRHPWAVEEARRTLSVLGVTGTARVDDLTRVPIAGTASVERQRGRVAAQARDQAAADRTSHRGQGVLLAFAVNEIDDVERRDGLRDRLVSYAASGGRVLIVEPLAGFVAPWWGAWQRAFEASGGRAHEWRFDVKLPAIVEKLDRAAGLNHRELKARTLSF